MSIVSAATIHYAFLTSCAVAFATTAALDEVRDGEPSLRGFVHAGIMGLVMTVMHTRSGNPEALNFSTFGLTLGARMAWFCGGYSLATALIIAAVEVLRFHDTEMRATGMYLVIALAASLPTLDRLADTLAFVAHVAFTCSVADPYDAVHGVVAATLALRDPTSPAALLFGCTCIRAAWSAAWACGTILKQADAMAPATQTHSDMSEAHTCFVGSRTYTIACALHVSMLTIDAWTCCGLDAVDTSTRMLHVSALAATLLYVIPAARETFPWMRWALTPFPLFDALLCAYRLAQGTSSVVLALRGLAALCEAAAIHVPAVRRDVRCAESPRTSRDAIIDRGAIATYAVVHMLQALRPTGIETALAIAFHYIVVTLALAWMGLEDKEWVSARVARVFLAIECVTSVVLFALLDQNSVLAASAASAAFLAWRVHIGRHHANLLFKATWLTLHEVEADPIRSRV